MSQSISAHASLLKIKNARLITARSRSNFSSAFLFLPAKKRLAMKRVYAFFRTIDDVVDEGTKLNQQRELLRSWRRELAHCYQGLSIVPLLNELKQSIDCYQIPQNYFEELIDGCEMDLNQSRYARFEDLSIYCYKVAATVGLVCLKIFEYQTPQAPELAKSLGLALQLTNIIRDVGVDLKKGRIYLPQEDLEKFKVSEEQLFKKNNDARFKNLMEFQYQRALGCYDQAQVILDQDKEGKLLVARIMSRVYRRILEKIRDQQYPVLHRRVALSFPEKVWILGKVAKQQYLD